MKKILNFIENKFTEDITVFKNHNFNVDNKVTLENLKEKYLLVIEKYFTGEISFDICVALAGGLWWDVIHLKENEKPKKRFVDKQFKDKLEEELFWDLHFTNEGSFSNYYFLTTKKFTMNPGIKLFITHLQNNYEKYTKELQIQNKLSKRYFNQTFSGVDFNDLQIKSSASRNHVELRISAMQIIVNFPVKRIKQWIVKLTQSELVDLFILACKAHDQQKISIDSISALSCCILENRPVKNIDFCTILTSASYMAFLERFSRNDQNIYLNLSKVGKSINKFVNTFNIVNE